MQYNRFITYVQKEGLFMNKGFTFKCNECDSEKVDISVTEYNKDGSYELMATCENCGNKEDIKQS